MDIYCVSPLSNSIFLPGAVPVRLQGLWRPLSFSLTGLSGAVTGLSAWTELFTDDLRVTNKSTALQKSNYHYFLLIYTLRFQKYIFTLISSIRKNWKTWIKLVNSFKVPRAKSTAWIGTKLKFWCAVRKWLTSLSAYGMCPLSTTYEHRGNTCSWKSGWWEHFFFFLLVTFSLTMLKC